MDTQPPLEGENRSNASWLAGTSSNRSLIGTPQAHRYQLVHRNTANAATNSMPPDANFKIVHKTGSSMNKKQFAVGCKYNHPAVNSVNNGSSFGPGRFYRSAWQQPYHINNQRFSKQTITLKQQILIRDSSVW